MEKRKRGLALGLEADRILLDAIRREDVPRLAEWFQDLSFLSLLSPGIVFPVSPEDEDAWFADMRSARAAGRTYTFAIRLRTGELLGSTSLMNVDGKNRSATFGIAIADPAARGKHYGLEATELLLRYGFEELNLHRVQLFAFAFNGRAIAMYRRAGFRVEGRKRESLFRDGRYHDEIVMSILEEEYRSRPYAGTPFIPPDVRPFEPDSSDPARS